MKAPRSITRLFPNVTKCVDAKKPVDIEVTPRDVSKSDAKSFTNCAMARAVCREWKADSAAIGLTYSYVVKGNTAVRFQTPDSVQREIVSFDRKADFAPGTYHLAAVPPSQRRKPSRSGAKKKSAPHGPKRRVFHKETLNVREMRKAA